ncbi:MAG: hypothetical protein M3463_01470 [Verrucomicrobiota bacterium]|nr:hypothetical protein [Verrucomicrobiota bacterium]
MDFTVAPDPAPELAAEAAGDDLSFSVPGFYGSPPTTYTAGSGRLARPRLEAAVSLSLGYDSNVFQTPSDPPDVPDTPEGDGGTLERVDSVLTRAALSARYHFLRRRTLLVLDADVYATYYWNLDDDPVDYSGSLAVSFLHRFTPRLQVSAVANAAYLTEPDFSRINTPESGGNEYLTANAKLDLSYAWTRRFSTVTSATLNRLQFVESAAEAGNYTDIGLGNEFRYLWNPRLTVLTELRHSLIDYENDPTRDAYSHFLLLGAEWRATRRVAASGRLGGSFREFAESGRRVSSPYAETALTWRLRPSAAMVWINRYGFEEPSNALDEVVSFRSGLSYQQTFSPQLSSSVAANYIHRTTENTVEGSSFEEDIIDTALIVQYRLNRNFTLNASAAFTLTMTSTGESDYNRTRLFLGGQYEF